MRMYMYYATQLITCVRTSSITIERNDHIIQVCRSSLYLQATKLGCQMLPQENSTVDRPESNSEDDAIADLAEQLWSYLEIY